MIAGIPLLMFGSGLSFFGLMLAAQRGGGGAIAPYFAVIGSLLLLTSSIFNVVSIVFMAMLLYQLWQLIPPQIARTTPGKAIGFCFIPFFNYYWVFIAFNGLGADMNKTLKQYGIQYQINETLGLIFCILFCVSIIPYLGSLAFMVAIILVIFFLKSVKNGANAQIRHRGY